MKLHGDLEVEVVSGEELKDKDTGLFHIVPGDWSDVWVNVKLGSTTILKTGVRKNARDAVWGERVSLPVCQEADVLEVSAWDKDYIRSELLGKGFVPLGDGDESWSRDGVVHLEGEKGRINMKISYTPAAQASQESIEVRRAYTPLRRGGSLTLYQDAHSAQVPGVGASQSAFQDIAQAIKGAKKFVYIAAWSLWTETRLERDGQTLGELLKQKASEGIVVLVLIWNEKFSAGPCAGLLSTYDEGTAQYFEGTGVHVAKVRRKRTGCPKVEQLVELVWTHHQKVIVVDGDGGGVVAFLGGLDLTKGRWDTPEHPLFSTLKGQHFGDFHNGFIELKETQGPREPWHDVHGRVTGPAALDVMKNFEERWRKQVDEKAHILVTLSEEDLKPPSGEAGDVTWQMQIVRSIDRDSVVFDQSRIGLLDNAAGRDVDTSLHRALVRLIRKAEKFIYIESQYFIGSSQEWDEDLETCRDLAKNMVPLEIAEKVVSKIRAGQDFRVYIVLPMIPEGNPDQRLVRCSMKSILYYQRLTLQMMYKRIAGALKEVGSKNHPTDHLLVLCLGKKESRSRVSRSLGAETPSPGSEESKWRSRSRFLIYVHSKMFLADDSFVLMGSANFNQRSLDGTHDSEIAVSACQVRRGSEKENVVTDGAVRDLRKSLWAEHTSGLSQEEEALADPSSLEAIRRLRDLSDEALETFAGEDSDIELRSRFLRFPFDVSAEGDVEATPGMSNVPDFDVPAVGCNTFLPSILTV